MNILDKAIGWVAPAAALRRVRARTALGLARGYDAAKASRHRDPWYSRGTSADAEISKAGGRLADNMRDLVRNSPYAANALHNIVTHAVGAGIVPRSKNKRVNELFAEWSRQCDADGHLDFFGIQTLALRGMLESGDGLVRRRRRMDSDGLPVPLQVQVVESDHIDKAKNGLIDGRDVFEGIGRDAIGRPAVYWLFRRHPGAPNGVHQDSSPVSVSDIAHCFEKQRAQMRGVPWGVAAINDLRDLAEYEAAEVLRKKMEACIVGVVTGGDDEQASVTGLGLGDDEHPGVYNSDGEVVERFEPGAFYHARGGRDIRFTQPAMTPNYDAWKVSKLHDIAAGFRVPYSLLSGNLSKVNYSSGKIGLETYKRTIDEIQWKILIPMLCQPIWDWFCEAAFLAGKIKARTVPVEWSPPRFISADEAKDIAARVAAMRSGLLSPLTAIAETGYTPDEVIADYVEWNKMLDKHGLIFDSDPRHMSQAGQTQQDGEPPDKEKDETEPA